MMRLAKARILANVQLQAEEQQQQAANQVAWQEAVRPETIQNQEQVEIPASDPEIPAKIAATVVTPLV